MMYLSFNEQVLSKFILHRENCKYLKVYSLYQKDGPASHASIAPPMVLNMSPPRAAPDDRVFSTFAYSHLPVNEISPTTDQWTVYKLTMCRKGEDPHGNSAE